MVALATYPYVAKYKDSTPQAGMVVLVVAPKTGFALYVPESTPGNVLYEVNIGDTLNLYRADLEPFEGTVKINNLTGSTLEIPQ